MKFKKCFHTMYEEYEEDKYRCSKCKKTEEKIKREKDIENMESAIDILDRLLSFPIDDMEDSVMKEAFGIYW